MALKAKYKSSPEIIPVKNFTKKVSAFLNKKKYSGVFILTDDNTYKYCLPVLLGSEKRNDLLESATTIKVYASEQHKNLQAAEYIWKRLTEENAGRNSVLLNLGGGMIGDLGGFAAATFKRGIDFIHLPTTLLAMCDASIGGKQGIDFNHYKNQVGFFKNPEVIFINEDFLKTLAADELVSGFAEVVKHALIAGGKFWKEIEAIEKIEEVAWKQIISESIDLKLSVVQKDPQERNYRKVLNLGHTIGHALETFLLNKYQRTLHGHCVAAGMMGELFLSEVCCGLPVKKRKSATEVIVRHFPKVHFTGDDIDSLIALMRQDKKNSSGKINMSLLEDFGKPVINQDVSGVLINEALQYMLDQWSVKTESAGL